MSVKLNDLFVGNADGDIESKKELFRDMFYKENKKYDEINNNWYKFIISGPKGSGKTILGQYIKKVYEDDGIQCKILKSDSIALSKLINIGKDSLDKSEIILFYKWFILVEISKIVLEKKLSPKDIEPKLLKRFHKKNRGSYKKYSESYDNLKKIYKDRFPSGNYESNSISTLDQISSILGGNIENGSSNIKVSTKSELQSIKKEEKVSILKPYFKIISEFEDSLFNCLKYHKVVLILDDIDEMKVKLDYDEDIRLFLEQLILVLKDINSVIKEKNLSPNKIILLLRSDILDTLNKYSSNLNKIIADIQVNLYWLDKDNAYPENHMLMDMIFNKIRLSCDEYKNLSNKEIYSKLFPYPINGKTAINYLLDFSFGRPRDIIFYLSTIQKRFPNNDCFPPTAFIQCESEYSNLLKNEVLNELALHFDINYVEDLFRLLRDFNKLSFYYKDIKKFYESNEENYTYITDIKKSISDLYTFGIIGNSHKVNYTDKDDKEYSEISYSWAYRRDGDGKINYNQQLSIHYGLRCSLGLKKKKKKRTRKKTK